MFIVANWKSNKTDSEAKEWIEEFPISNFPASQRGEQYQISNKEIIICPPFTLLSEVKNRIKNSASRGEHELRIRLGAQDVSPYDAGAYTGEISAGQIKEFGDYVIIGHSERRKYFFESEKIINQKLTMAQKYNLTPILCISDINQISASSLQSLTSKILIAYEPLFAIGTGQPDTPENADLMASSIKKELGEIPVLYGGSVTSKNVKSFTQMPNINGVLVGSASLDPLEFLEIIKNA